MTYLSVCSGIEAATVAWHPLGWQPWAFAEVEAFPSAVLAHHYPAVPNRGDMTRFQEWPDAALDVLVGGTPCQSFSVAGLRKGLADPRGGLMLTYLAIAQRYRPRWLVWENVPGVLSSDRGRAFGSLLGGLAELGYGFAYRVLDAQHFGVAQRRRRVFVVGRLGDSGRAAAVLFERASLSGHPAPRREAREDVAGSAAHGAAVSSGRGWWDDSEVGATIRAQDSVTKADTLVTSFVPPIANPLTARMHKGVNTTMDEGQTMVAHALRAEGFDASEDGTGRGTPLVPVLANALGANSGRQQIEQTMVPADMRVRRLTPRECERLQGFPDGYTAIVYRGKPAADGPRYKALGNSMAVPVMAWIGRRLALVEALHGAL